LDPVFITGSTGYIGRPLIDGLLTKGFSVHALARRESANRLPPGVTRVIGNALDASTFAAEVPAGATFVHLVGTPHPSPAKAAEFRQVDLASIKAALAAAVPAAVRHFVYMSVAHPAPVMRAYIAVREEGEALLRASGLRATILRPWYILGPGHWWPYALVPIYAMLKLVPATRSSAERLGLVTHRQMLAALVHAIEMPTAEPVRIIEVPEIRRAEASLVAAR
jgi:uncharacterized protein YbjT (DUF2867 family)